VTGESYPFGLRYDGMHCEAVIGGSQHIWPDLFDGLITMPLLIDDTPIVAFRAEDDRLLLTVQLFNANNELMVQVVDNELVFSAEQWDVEFQGRQLTVRHAPRNIFVSITFDPPSRVVLNRAHIWRNGIELDISPDRILVVNNQSTVGGGHAERCQVGLAVGDPPEGLGGAIFMGGVMRGPYPLHAPTEERVVRIAVRPQDDDHETIIEDFKSFLDGVSPDDFAV
jgi:trigger factor